jgi:hypothetical protein
LSDAWPDIKIGEFEFVAKGPGQAVLWVAGRGRRRRDPGPRPVLVIDDGTSQHRLSPLASIPERGRSLRAAYPAPTALVELARAFWLEHVDGSRTDLPHPVASTGKLAADTPVPAPEIDFDAARVHEQRVAELERAHARALDDARRETGAAEAREADAAARAAAAEGRVHTISEQLTGATRQRDELRRQLRELQATAESQRRRLAVLDRQLAEAIAAREPLEGQLREALAAKAPLEDELQRLRATRANLERELDHTRDQLRLVTMDRDEQQRQAQAYDEIAVKSRERAQQAESTHQKSSAALQELEVWRTELERRLAATTTELGGLRTAREADQRELERLRSELADAHRTAGGMVSGDIPPEGKPSP